MGITGFQREIYQDEFPAGVTEYSKEQFLKYRDELGEIIKVEIAKIDELEYTTRIHGTKAILILDGFSFGYGGEGPHGLIWLLKQCGLKYDLPTIYGGIGRLEFSRKVGE